MTDRPTGPATARFDCSECGQNVDGRELHTYVHCVLHKAGIELQDYGLMLTPEAAADAPAGLDVKRLRNAIHWSGMVLVDQVSGKPVEDGEATLLRYLRESSREPGEEG